MNIGLVKGKRKRIWTGSSFCKTQYAKEFLKAHLLVISILDECKRIGILDEVHDEGDYWTTRNLNGLANRVNGMTEAMQQLYNLIKNLPSEAKSKAAVEESPTHITKFEVDLLKKLNLTMPIEKN